MLYLFSTLIQLEMLFGGFIVYELRCLLADDKVLW